MNRREALRAVSLIMGGTVIGAQAFLSSCQNSTEDQKALEEQRDKAFSRSDIALLDEIGETIIPATDVPGAKAVGIGDFMTMMVVDVYEEKNQEAFREGLDKIRGNFEDRYGHSFMDGTATERHEFLSELNKELEVAGQEKKAEDEPEHYFRIMKELTLLGYFSSEIGSTQALRYVETPGRYDGCMPYQKGDKAWAV